MAPEQVKKKVSELEARMYRHAENLEFEEAARLRDEIRRIENLHLGLGGEAPTERTRRRAAG
jgi:excinuclease ABC subunit B